MCFYFTHCFLNRSNFHMDGPLFARPNKYPIAGFQNHLQTKSDLHISIHQRQFKRKLSMWDTALYYTQGFSDCLWRGKILMYYDLWPKWSNWKVARSTDPCLGFYGNQEILVLALRQWLDNLRKILVLFPLPKKCASFYPKLCILNFPALGQGIY